MASLIRTRNRAVRKIAREVGDAVDDVQHTLTKAGRRVQHEATEAAVETGAQVSAAARKAAASAGRRSRAVATRALAEAKARPFAAGAILAGVVALIGLAIGRARKGS